MARLVPVLSLLGLLLACLPALAAGSAAQAAGLTLQVLDKADMDAIEEQLGQRAGVMVTAVAANSPAAKAGFVQGEVILKIGDRMVDSPASVEAALAGKSGALEVVGFVITEEEGVQVVKRTLTLAGAMKNEPAPAPDAETQKKLKALEEAHKAGILSDAEYQKNGRSCWQRARRNLIRSWKRS
ncbi:MAG: hypothetical protein BWY76_01152 [bacterium ADurb.Bin429]|nr:MAG: hypothetical protein BWY76_01152 [bacterium ADurb.Bin429]